MATIGPNTAVAFTYYIVWRSLIANWLATPIYQNKMKNINGKEYQMKEIVIEGLLSIQAGENPRVIEEN